MKDLFYKITLTIVTLLGVCSAYGAEPVKFEANAPMIVPKSEPFRVEFTLNAMPEEGTFEAPDFKGFDVIAGPAVSKGHLTEIINGAISKKINYTITFVLLPQASGNLTIGSAKIDAESKTYSTRPIPIEVVDEGPEATQEQQGGQQGQQIAQQQAQGQIGKDDIILRLSVSQSTVFKGEPVRATFKLYRRVSVIAIDAAKFPSFNGFWAQELKMDNIPSQRETFNGKVYETSIIKEFLLYPQQAGTLTIEPCDMSVVAQMVVQNRNSNAFDQLFGGGHEVYEVKRKVQTPKINISVRELPAGAPESFTGAVGRFTMDATQPAQQLAANSSATYSIHIAGTGNLPFVQAPKLTLPASFEQYTVKTTESIKTSTAGISGYRQFDYPFIARAEGHYTITPVYFTYFDPTRAQYVTLSTKELVMEISPDGNESDDRYTAKGLSKEEVKMLGQDIRFIKLGRASLRSHASPFILSPIYFILLAGILLLFAAAYAALRKRIRESHNMALVRGKRANKVAVQRFRAAKVYMMEVNRHKFYEEMLRAMWGYMSDKFNIPVADLTKENVREELHKRDINSDETQRFSQIITKCEEAQYSPAASAQMGDVYREGIDFVSRIESLIKR